MSAASNYLELALLKHVFKNTAATVTGGGNTYVSPTKIYAALSTATLTDADTTLNSKEPPDANGYDRQSIASNWTEDADTTAGHIDNTNAITFGPCTTTNWGSIYGVAIMDSDAYGAGNMLVYANFASAKSVNVGDSLTFAAHELDIYLA